MNIGYDDGPDFEIPQSVVDAAVAIGENMCLCQQKADPATAWCWNWFAWRMDRMFQVEFVYGGSREDVVQSDDDPGATPWQYVQVCDIKEPKPAKSSRNRYPKFTKTYRKVGPKQEAPSE